MLQQGMVVARQATATSKSWFNDVIWFLFDTVRVPVFYLSKKRTENRFPVPVRAVNHVPVHETSQKGTISAVNWRKRSQLVWWTEEKGHY